MAKKPKNRKDSIPGPVLMVIGVGVLFISMYVMSISENNLVLFMIAGVLIAIYGLLKTIFTGIKRRAQQEMAGGPSGVSGHRANNASHPNHQAQHQQRHIAHDANRVPSKALNHHSHHHSQHHAPHNSGAASGAHQPQPQLRYCPSCGASVHQHQNFCGNCGMRLR